MSAQVSAQERWEAIEKAEMRVRELAKAIEADEPVLPEMLYLLLHTGQRE